MNINNEEKNLGNEFEEDLRNVAGAAEDLYALFDPYRDRLSGDESSLGDAQKNGSEFYFATGSQAEAGDDLYKMSGTSDGKSENADGISNLNSCNGDPLNVPTGDFSEGVFENVTGKAAEDASVSVFDTATEAAATELGTAVSTEAVGAAAGTAGGPVGILVGIAAGWAIDNIGTIIAVIGGIILTFASVIIICLGSWIPSVFDDATLAWNNRRTTESVERSKNNLLGAATTEKEISESFNQFRSFFISFKKGSSTGTSEDKWDGAYLLAAYSVYKNMYAGDTKTEADSKEIYDDDFSEFFTCYDDGSTTYLSDFAMIFTRFFDYLTSKEEVSYEKETIVPVEIPVYDAVTLKIIENGEVIARRYYTFSGKTETRDYESVLPEYVQVTVELEDHSIDSTTYYQETENKITYSPETIVTQETEVVRSLLSKSTVLYVLNIPADEQYKGDIGMNVTNAEYVDYLRNTMIEMLGITQSMGTGKFIWPIDDQKYGVGVYQLTDIFGWRDDPFGGSGQDFHEGIDISWSGCFGSEIRAAASGTVVSAGNINYVYIDHGDGYQTTYLHMNQVIVSVGQSITQGQVIGYLGSTGWSTGPHLHFGISKDGEYVDPLNFYQLTYDENGNPIYQPISGGDYDAHEPEYYRDMIIQAMNELGIPVAEDKVNRVIRQISTESGGDPLAIQHGYTDINSYKTIANWTCPWCGTRAQHRSDGYTCENYNRAHGLMQTITSTFLTYKIEGHDDIYNSYDNLLAALNYIKHCYPDDFSGIGEGHGY